VTLKRPVVAGKGYFTVNLIVLAVDEVEIDGMVGSPTVKLVGRFIRVFVLYKLEQVCDTVPLYLS